MEQLDCYLQGFLELDRFADEFLLQLRRKPSQTMAEIFKPAWIDENLTVAECLVHRALEAQDAGEFLLSLGQYKEFELILRNNERLQMQILEGYLLHGKVSLLIIFLDPSLASELVLQGLGEAIINQLPLEICLCSFIENEPLTAALSKTAGFGNFIRDCMANMRSTEQVLLNGAMLMVCQATENVLPADSLRMLLKLALTHLSDGLRNLALSLLHGACRNEAALLVLEEMLKAGYWKLLLPLLEATEYLELTQNLRLIMRIAECVPLSWYPADEKHARVDAMLRWLHGQGLESIQMIRFLHRLLMGGVAFSKDLASLLRSECAEACLRPTGMHLSATLEAIDYFHLGPIFGDLKSHGHASINAEAVNLECILWAGPDEYAPSLVQQAALTLLSSHHEGTRCQAINILTGRSFQLTNSADRKACLFLQDQLCTLKTRHLQETKKFQEICSVEKAANEEVTFRNATLMQELDQLRRHAEEVQMQLREETGRDATLQKSCSDLQEKLDFVNRELMEAFEVIERTRAELCAERDKCAWIESELRIRSDQLQEEQDKHNKYSEETSLKLNELSAALEQAQEQLNLLHTHYEQSTLELRNQLDSLQIEHNTVRRQAQKEKLCLEQQLADLQLCSEEAMAQVGVLEEEMARLQANEAKSRMEVARLAKSLELRDRQLQKLKQGRDDRAQIENQADERNQDEMHRQEGPKQIGEEGEEDLVQLLQDIGQQE